MKAEKSPYDVVIIGAGPGGYVAGIRAAQLGLKSCLIEKEQVGGVCLNWGCIPSKSLIHQATLIRTAREVKEIGAVLDVTGLDYGKIHEKSRQATQQLVKGVEFLLNKNKVTLIRGEAHIVERNRVAIADGTEISGKNILIATGSRPITLPGFEFDEKQILSSNGILSLTELPESLVILGAGAIGCEFAYIMNAFGVRVTLVEMADHILPFEDEDIATVLSGSFMKAGITVMTRMRAEAMEKTDKSVSIRLAGSDGDTKTVTAEKVLCVFGRLPNTEGIGLENIGLKTERGYIPVGDYNQTRVQGVFAIGDVVSTPLLAHVASKEGEVAVEFMAGRDSIRRLDVQAIPSAIYCDPQVASFGLRERQAKQQQIAYKKAVFPYGASGKAVAVGKTDGLVKVLCDPDTEEILGAHIVGENATEIIHELLLAKSAELLPEEIFSMIHAHPTLSEILAESMRAIDGNPIHL